MLVRILFTNTVKNYILVSFVYNGNRYYYISDGYKNIIGQSNRIKEKLLIGDENKVQFISLKTYINC